MAPFWQFKTKLMHSIGRREFIKFLGGAAAAWPLTARAQQAMPAIGFLNGGSPAAASERLRAFHQGLSESGFVEGRNVTIEYRWAEGQFERIPALAADLVRRQVAVIFTGGPPTLRPLMTLTTTIPIVFSMGEDPVKEGVVVSLNRPGGNITGHSFFANLLFGKWLGLLHECVPKAAAFGLLVNPDNPNAGPDAKDAQIATDALGRQLHVFKASTERDLEPAFEEMTRLRIAGLCVNIDFLFIERREQIVALAERHSIPAIYDRREFPAAGGLMSYGASQADSWRQGGVYVGRILKGEKPADLPVQQSTKFEFTINLKTAKGLRLDIPPGVLAIADEVIE
jgi:putative tryptophan/tyrosine transport system substrate-binding protein